MTKPPKDAAVGRTLSSADRSQPRPEGRTLRSADDEPKDQHWRDLIVKDFSRNLLVEAGPGSGKTHSLARRMAAGIACGVYQIEHMAAVTFTRKAAAELRGRFQLALEERLTELREGDASASRPVSASLLPPRLDEAKRLEHALSNLERFYAGTIHAFCAHLLRERPVESGIAPGFTELDELEDSHRREEAWRDYISRAKAMSKPELIELFRAGLRARDLDWAFGMVTLYEEVTFPPGDGATPDCASANKGIDKFWTALSALLPDPIAEKSTCNVQEKAQVFGRLLDMLDRSEPASVARLLEIWQGTSLGPTLKWWNGRDGYKVRELLAGFQSSTVWPFLEAWRHYLYRLTITLLIEAREHAGGERRRYNALNYGDLLQRAAEVLRTNPFVRRALQDKYRWLFVDEFQDTDPVQADGGEVRWS